MRSGLIIGTPQQLREWNIAAFLAVNLLFAFFVAWAWLMVWLQKVTWYNQTGGVYRCRRRSDFLSSSNSRRTGFSFL